MTKQALPRKVKDIKGKVAVGELRRAHWIIAILSLSLALVVTVGASRQITFEGWLAAVADILLLLLAIVSIGTALRLK